MSDYCFQTLNSKYKSYRSPYITKKGEKKSNPYTPQNKNYSKPKKSLSKTSYKKNSLKKTSQKKEIRETNPHFFEYIPKKRVINYRFSEMDKKKKNKMDQNQTLKLGSQTDIISTDEKKKEKKHNFIYDRKKTPKISKEWNKAKNAKIHKSFEISGFGKKKNFEEKFFKNEDFGKNRNSYEMKYFEKFENGENIKNRFDKIVSRNNFDSSFSSYKEKKRFFDDKNILDFRVEKLNKEILKLKEDNNGFKEMNLKYKKENSKIDFLNKNLKDEIECLKERNFEILKKKNLRSFSKKRKDFGFSKENSGEFLEEKNGKFNFFVISKIDDIIKNVKNSDLKEDLENIKNDLKFCKGNSGNRKFSENFEKSVLVKILNLLDLKPDLKKNFEKKDLNLFYCDLIIEKLDIDKKNKLKNFKNLLKREQGIQTKKNDDFYLQKNFFLEQIDFLKNENKNFFEKEENLKKELNMLKNKNKDISVKFEREKSNNLEIDNFLKKSEDYEKKIGFLQNELSDKKKKIFKKAEEIENLKKDLKQIKKDFKESQKTKKHSEKNLTEKIETLKKTEKQNLEKIKNLTENLNNLKNKKNLEKSPEKKNKNKQKQKNIETPPISPKNLSKSLFFEKSEISEKNQYFSHKSEILSNSENEENCENQESINEEEMNKIEIFIKDLIEKHEKETKTFQNEIECLKSQISRNLKYKADFEILEQKVKIEDLVKNQLILERDDLRESVNEKNENSKNNFEQMEILKKEFNNLSEINEGLKDQVEDLILDKKELNDELEDKINENEKIRNLLQKFEKKVDSAKEKINNYKIEEIYEKLNLSVEKNGNYENEIIKKEKEIKILKRKFSEKSQKLEKTETPENPEKPENSEINKMSEINYLKDTITNLQEDINDLNELLLRQTEELDDYEILEKEFSEKIENLQKDKINLEEEIESIKKEFFDEKEDLLEKVRDLEVENEDYDKEIEELKLLGKEIITLKETEK